MAKKRNSPAETGLFFYGVLAAAERIKSATWELAARSRELSTWAYRVLVAISAWPNIDAISRMLATPTKYEAWECRKVWSVVVFGSIPATFKTARQALDGLLIG